MNLNEAFLVLKIENGLLIGQPIFWETFLYDNPNIEESKNPSDETIKKYGFERFIYKEVVLQENQAVDFGEYIKNSDGYWEQSFVIRQMTDEELRIQQEALEDLKQNTLEPV